MFEKEIAARNELRKAFVHDSLTHLVTQGKYQIEYSLNSLYIYLDNKFVITIYFNHELTQYITIAEFNDERNDNFGERISTFNLDKFFTPEMTVKVLHNAITELEHVLELDLVERVHGMVD
jgi:hypothetical protein